LAHALNTGYRTANENLVVKSDCDTLREKNTISTIVADFADPRGGGVTGKQLLCNDNKTEKAYKGLYDSKRIIDSQFGAAYEFEPFCAFRKAILKTVDAVVDVV